MRNSARPASLRYGLAIAVVALATVLTHLLIRYGDAGLTPLFFAAVLVSAWFGGIGPGLLATLLSGVAAAYLLLQGRQFTAAAMVDHIPRLLIFCIVSILIGALQEAMRRARTAAESANHAKTQFVAMVSHELRTPLSPVVMAAEMLESDPHLPPALRKDVQTIRRNVQTEIRLIDDLVDLTRISYGKMSLQHEAVDLHKVLRSAVEICQADAADKQLQISMQLSAVHHQVTGDAVRLQQVFWNLLRNAIKFTPEGENIFVSTRDVGPETVQIEMTDTGIGIEPQKLSKIFEAFEQGGAEIQQRFGGLGLGLAICRALVQAHGGAIGVQSDGRGRGATFTVTLPAMPCADMPRRRDDGTIAAAHGSADDSGHR